MGKLLMDKFIETLVRPEVRALSSYHVPDASGLLKLDAMENPHTWPGAELQQAWLERMATTEANRYPDPSASKLKAALRERMGLDELEGESGLELDILFGNGSDELIQIMAMALASTERCIMAPEPSFVMYKMIAQYVNMPYVPVALGDDFELDADEFIAQMQQHNPALVFLAVPNNPTGNVFELAAIEAIIEACSGLVVIDEAYLAFTDSDLLELCVKYPNVVVMRTLSKVGLAGLRLGFLIGTKAWLSEFDKLRLPYNINVLTQESALFALEHYQHLIAQTDGLCEARTDLYNELVQHELLEPFESEANFILVRVLEKSARDVFESMKAQGVLIKCLDGAHPALANCLRLTVGRPEDNTQMLAALRAALA